MRAIVFFSFFFERCTVTSRCGPAHFFFSRWFCLHLSSCCCLDMQSSPGFIGSTHRFAESCWRPFSTSLELSLTLYSLPAGRCPGVRGVARLVLWAPWGIQL